MTRPPLVTAPWILEVTSCQPKNTAPVVGMKETAAQRGTVAWPREVPLFERFTDATRSALVLAQDEAHQLGHDYIGTEHLLLGVIRQGSNVAALVLVESGLALDRAREAVHQATYPGSPRGRSSIAPPFTPRAKKAINLALHESLNLGRSHVGPEHLLLGIIREGNGVACHILVSTVGVGLMHLRDEITRRARTGSAGDAGPDDPDPRPRAGSAADLDERDPYLVLQELWKLGMVRAPETAEERSIWERLAAEFGDPS